MIRSKLSEHVKIGDTFFTPFNNPDTFGESLKLTSWAKDTLPDYFWVAMILHALGSKQGIKTMRDIVRESIEIGVSTLNLSKLFELDEIKQEQFWSVVLRHVDSEVLKPLAIVVTPETNNPFFDVFFDPNISMDKSASGIINIVKKCGKFHDDLSTDICYVVVVTHMICGNMVIADHNTMFIESMEGYIDSIDNNNRETYGTAIRSCFQAIRASEEQSSFPCCFWKTLGELTDCNPLVVTWDEVYSMEYFLIAADTLDFIAASNENKKMETKYMVVMGLTCYIFKLFEEIVHKKLYSEIAGRILFRTMIEGIQINICMKSLVLRPIVRHESR